MSMIKRMSLVLVAAGLLAAGCSQVLGLKDPKLEDQTVDASIAAPADAPIDGPPVATCPVKCTAGCETGTNICKAEKLFVFITTGGTIGNAFGGTDVPPTVRAGADARCLGTYTATHVALGCEDAKVHAVLHVNAADGLPEMSSNYRVPTDVPVHRATDDVLVSNNWNDFVDPAKGLRAPVSTGTEAEGIVWTGANRAEHCTNWTSIATGLEGTQAFTTNIDINWRATRNFRCDRPAKLLCVCWSGGR